MKTLVLLPTYNEARNLPEIVPEIFRFLPDAHLLVIDDRSPDGTGPLADTLAETYLNRLFVLHRQKKEGLGRAYVAGFQWALERDYDVVFEMDADFSHHPRYLPVFLKEIEKGADLVIGSRYIRGGGVKNWSWNRRWLSKGGNFYSRLILRTPLSDLTGGFKCFRRKVLESLVMSSVKSNGYLFQIEMNYLAWKAGFKIKEIPILFEERREGVSKMSRHIIVEALLNVWQLSRTPPNSPK